MQHFFQLEAGTSTYVHFPFVATVIGDVTVKLSAYSFLDRDEEEFTISVSVSTAFDFEDLLVFCLPFASLRPVNEVVRR